MKRFFSIGILLLLICGGKLYAQGVRVQINGNQSFVLDETNGMYFNGDVITVDGVEFSIDDIQVITLQVANDIAKIESLESLDVMPNPVREAITLRGIGNEPQTVTLYSMAGVKLLEQKASDGTVINISHLPEGMYVLRCGDKVAKVIKQL